MTLSTSTETSPLTTALQVIENVDSRNKIQQLLEKLFQDRVSTVAAIDCTEHLTIKLRSAYDKPIPDATLSIPQELRFMVLEDGALAFDLPAFSPWLETENCEKVHCDTIRLEQDNYRLMCIHKNENGVGYLPIVVPIEMFLAALSANSLD